MCLWKNSAEGGNGMDIKQYWEAVLKQQADKMRAFFHEDACICWHNSNERFSADEFIRVNCAYPGRWDGVIENVIETEDMLITVLRVFSEDGKTSLHATSFIKIKDGKIAFIDEYWGDDGEAPAWRQKMKIGRKIRQ